MADKWLDRSGQRWKKNGPLWVGLPGGALVLAGSATADAGGMWAIVGGLALVAAALPLPFLIGCRVCGLRLQSSVGMRRARVWGESAYLEGLEACPVCGDDGQATAASRAQWLASGRSAERAYWSAGRLAIAALFTLLVFGLLWLYSATLHH